MKNVNVLQILKKRKGPEFRPVCEDSKVKLYLSVMPSRAYRAQRFHDTVKAVTKALRLFFGPALETAAKALLTIGVTMVAYEIMHIHLAAIRNSSTAIGGEIFIAPAITILALKAMERWRSL